ncbi:phosphate ABC transporter permease subunit PstC [Laceyella sacchari]|jgi:phosphate transport system permease protein|uniref:Phosphate transport system permease protein n=2 Tax=Laceyella TaxID=292635 RepID=A0AA46ADC4_9BACL|nr:MULTISPECIES: phosphate ABC transporter permease subunit PstC [Laceyella]AUS08239.1 phosphate ABC transporter permease subunit PstC [Laceyella sacchari]MRG26902.1 phosphate ABC transporter permease subunit PstC [Laceyella tengchongensis]PRZ16044.1 phosphate transport system permease protein [Laceyella sediminis]SMP04160.1 phosphate ABC transporter membrane protein 1, PhoT family [Laceyella tengchongensis]
MSQLAEKKNFFRKEKTWREKMEALIPGFLLLCGLLSVLTTVGIVFTLIKETASFFAEVPFVDFITGTKWTALFSEDQREFGILPLLIGSLQITLGAAVVAVPLGIGSAIYLSEYAPERIRRVIKPVLEVLAGIPTIVFGYFGVTFVTPLLRDFFPDMDFFNALSASIVVGIMILPMIASLSEDAMRSVPRNIREAAYGLGSTRLEVSLKVVLPAALSGIVASFVLALSRAVGETMAVTIIAGSTPSMSFSYLESIQTMTAFMVQASTGDISYHSLPYYSIYAVGATLFVITLTMNLLALYISRRYKEEY